MLSQACVLAVLTLPPECWDHRITPPCSPVEIAEFGCLLSPDCHGFSTLSCICPLLLSLIPKLREESSSFDVLDFRISASLRMLS